MEHFNQCQFEKQNLPQTEAFKEDKENYGSGEKK